MSTLLTCDEAKVLTAPYHDHWRSAFHAAEEWYWQEFRKWDPQAFSDMDAAARAHMLNRRIVGNVQRGDGITMSDALGFPVQILNCEGRYAIARFKMLDLTMKPGNHPSDLQDDLQHHQFPEEAVRQLELDGGQSDAPTILVVGYQLNMMQTAFVQLAVVSWHNESLRFWYDPEVEEDKSSGVEIVPFPIIPPDETRVVPKPREKKAESTDSDIDPGGE